MTAFPKEQHKAAAALTNAFYLNHRAEEEGEFVAFKTTRTLVERPRAPLLTEPRRTLLPLRARDLGKGGFVADPIQWPQWLKK